MKSIKTILLVEDNLGDARLLREMFYEHDTHHSELIHVGCMKDAKTYLSTHAVGLILLDLGLPDAHGLEAIRQAHAVAPGVPLVVLTGLDDESLAAQALQEGAQDYLIKGQIETRGLLRALRYANERKRLEQLKDEFVSSVSHELRTPMTSISASLGLLVGKAAGNLPGPMARLLTIAHTNSQRLVRLINDILDIERMDSGRVVFNFRRVEVRSLVEQAIEANWVFAEGQGVRVRLEDGCAVGDVRADPDRLAQVVANLLSNAIKFSPAGHEVVVAIEKGADVVRISVRDHGPGISADFRPRIFERFAQADATNTRQKGGSGLGLSIVKEIVGRLSGEVGFADASGGGTVFHVQLPCWKHVAIMAVDLDEQPAASRMLFCGDDLDTAVALREQMMQVGFATDFAYTADDAFTYAATNQYHAVLVSRQLPDGDGTALILRLRALPHYRDTPIIVVSDEPVRERDDLKPSKLNVLGWLNKPVNFVHLMQVLGKAIMHHEDSRPHVGHVGDDNVVTRV